MYILYIYIYIIYFNIISHVDIDTNTKDNNFYVHDINTHLYSNQSHHIGYGVTMTFTASTALYEFRIQTSYTKMAKMKLQYYDGSSWKDYLTNLDKTSESSLFVTIDSRHWWQVLTNNTSTFSTQWRMICTSVASKFSNEYWQELYLRGIQ